MEPYLFQGLVLPHRAQMSDSYTVEFSHLATGVKGIAKVSIIHNQISVWIEGEYEWDIFDLRNAVKNLIQGRLAIIGYLKGFAYDVEVTRVINVGRGIDYVFGIDTPCIAGRNPRISLDDDLSVLLKKCSGELGLYFQRCFNDLVFAMKHSEDTGFYCYRAIESLRHHASSVHSLSEQSKSAQWAKFREIAGCSEQVLREIKEAADPLRHGETVKATGLDREALFEKTWTVVDGYLQRA